MWIREGISIGSMDQNFILEISEFFLKIEDGTQREGIMAGGNNHLDASNEDETEAPVFLRDIARQARKEPRRSSREQDQMVVDRGCTYQQFSRMNPSAFSGGPNPIVAKDWLQEMDDLLEVSDCTEEQKVKYTALKLVGEAKR
ncbi:uncharacterized protein LOC131144287 [Malania oleifera]|uniref:uncharacterized protein LOC131144287 n=1 Tax=Malania oleifera TaxID=397392 RepID=UPI0025AE726C|nr:uncharacterized protein LOC131144287 [Malania oleifera]